MHVFDGLWVVSQNTKVVNGVSVYGVAVDFFVVVKHAVTPERSCADNMAVGQDVAVANGQLTLRAQYGDGVVCVPSF